MYHQDFHQCNDFYASNPEKCCIVIKTQKDK